MNMKWEQKYLGFKSGSKKKPGDCTDYPSDNIFPNRFYD